MAPRRFWTHVRESRDDVGECESTVVLLPLLSSSAARSRVVCSLGSLVHLFRGVGNSGELVWTQCAMGVFRGVLSRVQRGRTREILEHHEKQSVRLGRPAGDRETVDADVQLALSLVLAWFVFGEGR